MEKKYSLGASAPCLAQVIGALCLPPHPSPLGTMLSPPSHIPLGHAAPPQPPEPRQDQLEPNPRLLKIHDASA